MSFFSLKDGSQSPEVKLNLLMKVVAKCLHFVMSHMRQNKKGNQTLESPQYRLEIFFNNAFIIFSVMIDKRVMLLYECLTN